MMRCECGRIIWPWQARVVDEDANIIHRTCTTNGEALERVMQAQMIEETLAFVDKALDNVANLPADLAWENREVVGVLEDIRSLLLTGSVVPGTFAHESTDSEAER